MYPFAWWFVILVLKFLMVWKFLTCRRCLRYFSLHRRLVSKETTSPVSFLLLQHSTQDSARDYDPTPMEAKKLSGGTGDIFEAWSDINVTA